MSSLEYRNRDTGLQSINHYECLKFIQEHVAPDVLMLSSVSDKISYYKVTKNDSIKRTVDKLQSNQSTVACVFSYGPHIQKMLSILEIYKKVSSKQDGNTKLRQWNRLHWFVQRIKSRNELIHVNKRVPILITILTTHREGLSTSGIQLKEFTEQS